MRIPDLLLLLSILVVPLSSGQSLSQSTPTPMPGHHHVMNGMVKTVDGSVTSDQIPDATAYYHFFVTMSSHGDDARQKIGNLDAQLYWIQRSDNNSKQLGISPIGPWTEPRTPGTWTAPNVPQPNTWYVQPTSRGTSTFPPLDYVLSVCQAGN